MMNKLTRVGILALLMVAALALGDTKRADAALMTFTTVGCAGFEACSNAAFDAAVGPATFISFSFDKFGNPTVDSTVDGGIYSNDVTFSTLASGFGPNSPNVEQGNDSGVASEIGPTPGFNGILNIVFTTPVFGVGFGTVTLETNEFIRIFDSANNLIGTFNDPSDNLFDYFGVIASGGQDIGRIELEGGFYAIQDITFGASAAAPEPATLLLLGSGLAAVGLFGRKRVRN